MLFNLKRFYYGVLKRRIWLSLILIIPSIYLISASIKNDRFSVTQFINVSENFPIAASSNPIGFKPVKDIISEQQNFLLNSFIINKIAIKFSEANISNLPDKKNILLKKTVKNSMNMYISGNNRVAIKYSGKNLKTGKILVPFYSKLFKQKGFEGAKRSKQKFSASMFPTFSGEIETKEFKAGWRWDRLIPLVLATLLSIFGVLIFIGFLEWNDTSFKSEKQIARYSKLPVLGSVPDLDKMGELIDTENG